MSKNDFSSIIQAIQYASRTSEKITPNQQEEKNMFYNLRSITEDLTKDRIFQKSWPTVRAILWANFGVMILGIMLYAIPVIEFSAYVTIAIVTGYFAVHYKLFGKIYPYFGI